MSVWRYSGYKTATYELATNLADISVYRLLVGGTLAGVGLFTVANVATQAVAYYAHEVLWNIYGPDMQQSSSVAMSVGFKKLLIYRGVSTARNLALVYAFSGSVPATLGYVAVINVINASIYAANEYGWYAYGPPIEKLDMASPPPQLGTPVGAVGTDLDGLAEPALFVTAGSTRRLRMSAAAAAHDAAAAAGF
jgi:hypothetical protein